MMRALQIALLTAALLTGGALAQARKPNPAPRAPVISTTSRVPEYQAAETRLAQFITALQLDRRERAARMLSSRVGPADRRALIEKRWLRRSDAKDGDFTQILFLSDLQIRTRRIQRGLVRLAVHPRSHRKQEKRVTGYLEVTMRKEHGRWWVELRPEDSVARG
jgi:hypothetical protein